MGRNTGLTILYGISRINDGGFGECGYFSSVIDTQKYEELAPALHWLEHLFGQQR